MGIKRFLFFLSQRYHLFGILLLLVLFTAIPLTVFMSRQRQNIRQQAAGTGTQHYLYVFTDGTMSVYDIDNNHALVKQVNNLPTSGVRGVAASAATGMVYVSSCGGGCGNGSLVKINLLTDTVVWNKTYPFGVDSMAISPDGKTIYMPDGQSDGKWYIIDANTGTPTGATINTQTYPHNTEVSFDGKHVYMGGYQSGAGRQYLYEADTATNAIIKQIGPFREGIRPFTFNRSETIIYTGISQFLGFGVGDITSGKVLYEVPIAGFTWSGHFVSTAPSHGVTLSPDEKTLYVMDGPNSYVHVFDVSGVPASVPKQVADIPLTKLSGQENSCASWCEREGWVAYSNDGRFVYVGDAGDVIDAAARKVVAHIPKLADTRKFLEVDWQNGAPTLATSRIGRGFPAASGKQPPPTITQPTSLLNPTLVTSTLFCLGSCPTTPVLPTFATSAVPLLLFLSQVHLFRLRESARNLLSPHPIRLRVYQTQPNRNRAPSQASEGR